MFLRNIAKYMCIFTLILPSFSFAAMQGLKGYYYDNDDFTGGPSCINIGTGGPYSSPYASITDSNGNPFRDNNSSTRCFYVDPVIDFGWGGATADSATNIYGAKQPRGKPLQIQKGNGINHEDDYWSIKWRGYIKLPETNIYTFWIKYKSSYDFKLDGQKGTIKNLGILGVAHEWRSLNIGNSGQNYATYAKGFYKLDLDFRHTLDNAFIHLGYTINNSSPSNKEREVKIIPKEWLYTSIPKSVSFTKPSYSVKEGEGNIKAEVTINELPECGEDVILEYKTKDLTPPKAATANADYIPVQGEMSFTCHDTNKTKSFEIQVLPDNINEQTEIFDIVLKPKGIIIVDIEEPIAKGIIYDKNLNVEVEFTSPKYQGDEGETLVVPLRISKAHTEDFQVNIKYIDKTANYGEDYRSSVHQTVFFKANTTQADIKIALIDDGIMEKGNEEFDIEILGATNGVTLGALTKTTVTIVDNKRVNKCFDQSETSSGDAVKDGWRLLRQPVSNLNETDRVSDVKMECNYRSSDPLKAYPITYPTFINSNSGGMTSGNPYYAEHFFAKDINGNPMKRLRLAEGKKNKSTAIAFDKTKFPAKDNYIILEFDYYSYGGCVKLNDAGDLLPRYKYGGDGATMVLYDASALNPTPGAWGGSLGYAQRQLGNKGAPVIDTVVGHSRGTPGFSKGWLGVGLDEYGMFSISNSGDYGNGAEIIGEGRWSALKSSGIKSPTSGTPITFQNRVVLRGSGDGMDGYRYIATSYAGSFDEKKGGHPLGRWGYKTVKDRAWAEAFVGTPVPLKCPVNDNRLMFTHSLLVEQATDYWAGRFRLTIDNRDENKTLITIDRNIGQGYKPIIDELNVQDPKYDQAPLPEFLKLAFTSSTGGGCAIREVANIVIKANSCGLQNNTNEYRVVEEGYTKDKNGNKKDWQWVWNSPLRTKIAGNEGRYCVLAGDSNESDANPYKGNDKNVTVLLTYSKVLDDENSTLRKQNPVFLKNSISEGDQNLTFLIKESKAEDTTAYCFDFNETAGTRAFKEAYFNVVETNRIKMAGNHIISSDFFSVRPRNYTLSIKDKDNSPQKTKKINGQDTNMTVLIADSQYTYDINATRFHYSIPELNQTATIGYLSKLDSKIINDKSSKLKAILTRENKGVIESLDCCNTSNLFLGKKSSSSLHKLVFRDGESKYKNIDNVINPSDGLLLDYNNTMKFDVNIEDKSWTKVDFNMTKFGDLNSTSKTDRIKDYGLECMPNKDDFKNRFSIDIDSSSTKNNIEKAIKNYGEIVFCDINETYPETIYFRPNHFNANLLSLNDAIKRADGNFTYVADSCATAPHMAADINLTINAMSAKNNITTNYQSQCYANDVDFNISFVGNNFNLSERTVAGFDDSNRTARYRIWYDGDSHKYPDVNTSHLISKSPTSKTTDGNASFRIPNAKFTGGGVNTSVNFNFKRLANVPYEPFKINQDDFNLTHITDINYTSRVTNSIIDGNNSVKGGHTENNSSIADGFSSRPTTPDTSTSTFYYGRAYTPENYKGAIDTDIKGSTYFLAYCLTCDKVALNIMTNWPLRLGVAWYQNLSHNELFPDGNITNYESTNGYSQDTVRVRNSSAHQSSQDIEKGEEPVVFRSNTPGIDLVKMHASPWLIFNESNSTANTVNFPVEFFGTGGDWAGQGTTRRTKRIVGTTSIDINNTSDRVQDRIEW